MLKLSKVIVTTGPESCGKTSLALALGASLHCPVMPELARDYLHQKLLREPAYRYGEADLFEIARQHLEYETTLFARAPEHLILDTDLLVLLIWHQMRFGGNNARLQAMFEESLEKAPRLYLLCSPDLPWQPDPLRENPDDRLELFKLYQQKIEQFSLPCHVVEGFGASRLEGAMAWINAKR